ncbi:hypothetical protein QVD17_30867 [Tagetes erecta]|uniref:Integrase catalytic domain-containing protein n=1 Tax=Tagetes erecta TaxID=13708 RepID=A0AAD8NNP5_TARER|nr:hypothetical protein QVD17_30867 [Tagetes erecta]
MLHMDLFGPTNVQSIGKKSYFLVIIDDFTQFSWVYFLHAKSETADLLKEFIIKFENQLDSKVKILRSDNGTEFKNANVDSFYAEKDDAKIPFTLWDEATATACFVPNRMLLSKSDDGFFLGYSSVSKAYRVYSRRTNVVLETLNVQILENSFPIVAYGPDWLFDLYSLSKSFNSKLFDFSGKSKKQPGYLGSSAPQEDQESNNHEDI